MKYCSLDEAWGTNFENKDGCDVYFQHKKKFEEDRPSNTPNSHNHCKKELPPSNLNVKGYSSESRYYENKDVLFNNKKHIENKNIEFEDKSYDEKDSDVYSFINTLSLDNYTKKILITKINKLVDNIKYEPQTQTEVKEHFSPYYIQNESKSIDLLFLVLLGLFLIFIMDRK